MHLLYDQTEYDQFHFLTTTIEKEGAYWTIGICARYKDVEEKRYLARIHTGEGYQTFSNSHSPIAALSEAFKNYRQAGVKTDGQTNSNGDI